MKAKKKWFLRPSVLVTGLFFLWLTWAIFFPSRVVVHYNNPDKPIYVSLRTENNSIRQVKILEEGTRVLYLKRFYSRWDSYFSSLSWGYENNGNRKAISGIGFEVGASKDNPEGFIDSDACRVDVYLDKNAKLIRTEVKHPMFLYACW
jgi:hypothetical protein